MKMEANVADQQTLDLIFKLMVDRRETYESAVQTTICGKMNSAWQNLLTKVDFVCKSGTLPGTVTYEYPEVLIVRRCLSCDAVGDFLKALVCSQTLQTDHIVGSIAVAGRFSMAGNTRQPHGEWSRWPANVFHFDNPNAQHFPGNAALVALDAPYYPTLDQVLYDLFEIRSQSWSNLCRDQTVIVVPDFRARMSKLTIALACIRVDLECRFIQPTDLVLKVYAENSNGRLAQQTVKPSGTTAQIDLAGTPTFASLALMSQVTGETLDERSYRTGIPWRDPDVFIEEADDEIEQMLLTGESETIEFKVGLEKSGTEKLARTATAFANTKGGTIVFGVDNDHHVVGCAIKGMADAITNIIRDNCDPPPQFTIDVVKREGKTLLLVRVSESSGAVCVAKDRGPLIRANGTNRSPNGYELDNLYHRRKSPVLQSLGLS